LAMTEETSLGPPSGERNLRQAAPQKTGLCGGSAATRPLRAPPIPLRGNHPLLEIAKQTPEAQPPCAPHSALCGAYGGWAVVPFPLPHPKRVHYFLSFRRHASKWFPNQELPQPDSLYTNPRIDRAHSTTRLDAEQKAEPSRPRKKRAVEWVPDNIPPPPKKAACLKRA
jgi:hypothetical protein